MGVDPKLTTHSCLLLPSWLQLCEKFRVNASHNSSDEDESNDGLNCSFGSDSDNDVEDDDLYNSN